jgi:hypothetical protein
MCSAGCILVTVVGLLGDIAALLTVGVMSTLAADDVADWDVAVTLLAPPAAPSDAGCNAVMFREGVREDVELPTAGGDPACWAGDNDDGWKPAPRGTGTRGSRGC